MSALLCNIYHKMERIWHHNKHDKSEPSTKTHRLGKEDINQEATKRPKIAIKGQGSCTVETSVSFNWTIINRTPHIAGLYGRVTKTKAIA